VDIHEIVAVGDLISLQALINEHPDAVGFRSTSAVWNYGYTPLHQAAACGQIAVARFLIENGASLDATEESGFYPLHVASANGRLEIVKLLIENGADIDAKNRHWRTALIKLLRTVETR